MNTILPNFHNFHLKISTYKFSQKSKTFESHIYTSFLFAGYLTAKSKFLQFPICYLNWSRNEMEYFE